MFTQIIPIPNEFTGVVTPAELDIEIIDTPTTKRVNFVRFRYCGDVNTMFASDPVFPISVEFRFKVQSKIAPAYQITIRQYTFNDIIPSNASNNRIINFNRSYAFIEVNKEHFEIEDAYLLYALVIRDAEGLVLHQTQNVSMASYDYYEKITAGEFFPMSERTNYSVGYDVNYAGKFFDESAIENWNKVKWYDETLKLPEPYSPSTELLYIQNFHQVGWNKGTLFSDVNFYELGADYVDNSPATFYAVWTQLYQSPALRIIEAYRCDSAGTEDPVGQYVYIKYRWSIFDTQTTEVTEDPNSATLTISSDDTGYSQTYDLVGLGSEEEEKVDLGLTLGSTYVIDVTLEDSTYGVDTGFYISEGRASTSVRLSAEAAIDLLEGGNGIAFGGYATEEDTMDIFHRRMRNMGEQFYPTFMQTTPPTNLSSYPVSPCFVYCPTNNRLYFYTGD